MSIPACKADLQSRTVSFDRLKSPPMKLALSAILCFFVLLPNLRAADAVQPTGANPATDPQPRNPWMDNHLSLVRRAKQGNIDLLFLGDSITAGWGSPQGGAAIWNDRFKPLKADNFGISGDRTENVLWRVQNGEVDGLSPKVVVLMIGTNNRARNDTAPQIADGIKAIVQELEKRCPTTKILLLGVFPTGEKPGTPSRTIVSDVNKIISSLDDGKTVFYLDLGDKFLEPDGTISRETMSDFLHCTAKGYKIWADAMQEKLMGLLQGH